MDKSALPLSRPKSAAGFSLVEVALAIGIIAFAFIALFSLIPTGLTTFRSAIDTANETWILQGISSMVQTTDFAKIDSLNYKTSKDIFYYDEEAKLTDREKQDPPADAKVKANRLYAVKLITQKLFRPDGTKQTPNGDPPPPPDPGAPFVPSNDPRVMNHGWRIVVAFAPYQDPKAMAEFKKLEDYQTLLDLPKESNVHTRTFFVSRMDSAIQ
jgi:uncharacterized protein (TIGR02598 family)